MSWEGKTIRWLYTGFGSLGRFHVLCLFLLHFETVTALVQRVHGIGVFLSPLLFSLFSYDIILSWLPRRILPPSTPFISRPTIAVPPPEAQDISFLFLPTTTDARNRMAGQIDGRMGKPGFFSPLFLVLPRILEYNKKFTFIHQLNWSPHSRMLWRLEYNWATWYKIQPASQSTPHRNVIIYPARANTGKRCRREKVKNRKENKSWKKEKRKKKKKVET